MRLQTLEAALLTLWRLTQLLGLPSSDLDVSISTMTGHDFATRFAQHVDSLSAATTPGAKKTSVGCIAANPDQSKHLETATARLFDHDLDFVQLRSEEYGQGSRIPTGVVRSLATVQRLLVVLMCMQ